MPTHQELLDLDAKEGGWAIHDGTNMLLMFPGKDSKPKAEAALPEHEAIHGRKLMVVRYEPV
jgi:hypothetical protein